MAALLFFQNLIEHDASSLKQLLQRYCKKMKEVENDYDNDQQKQKIADYNHRTAYRWQHIDEGVSDDDHEVKDEDNQDNINDEDIVYYVSYRQVSKVEVFNSGRSNSNMRDPVTSLYSLGN
ncbi:hypothetical protein QYF36_009303 [Acer negundo]|nr:hypothetical protein QYF36_009303 [Acer negundo]